MRKIGATDSGSIIVEFSLNEWDIFSKSGRVPLEADLYEWSDKFSYELRVLDLPRRVKNAIGRATRVMEEKHIGGGMWAKCEPYVASAWVFRLYKGSRLLDFEEWVDAVLSDRIGGLGGDPVLSIGNFGVKSMADLIIALKKYRGGSEEVV